MICYSYSYSILYFSESRNIGIIIKKYQQICFFILDLGLKNLRARGRLTEFRFGMALH